MKKLGLIIFFITIIFLNGFTQDIFPVQYRLEKQSMSTPMSPIEDIFFGNSYYTKPINVKFDGAILNMYYDNGATFVNKELTKVKTDSEYEDNILLMETFIYTDNSNPSDTILFVVDYEVSYMQVILTTKNSMGEKIGYTSYRAFVEEEKLAAYRKSKEVELALN